MAKKMVKVGFVLSAVILSCNVTYASLTDGLVAHWCFNGSSDDISIHGNDAVITGASPTEDFFGNPNSAYLFDGNDDYMDIGNNVKPSLPITVSSWINLNSMDAGNLVFRNDRYDNRSYRNGIAIQVLTDGRLASHVFEGFSSPSNRVNKISNDSVASVGEWSHFAVVFNAHNNMQLYWNGTEVAGYYEGYGSGLSYSSSNGAMGLKYTSEGATYYDGSLDDILVYDRTLSSNEVFELYNNGPHVPEPASIAILGLGSLLLKGRRDRSVYSLTK